MARTSDTANKPVGGNKAKRKALKVGMKCAFTYQGSGTESKKIACE